MVGNSHRVVVPLGGGGGWCRDERSQKVTTFVKLLFKATEYLNNICTVYKTCFS